VLNSFCRAIDFGDTVFIIEKKIEIDRERNENRKHTKTNKNDPLFLKQKMKSDRKSIKKENM
jgi:hypothetical protein